MADVTGDKHHERVFWSEFNGGLRGFTVDEKSGRVLSEYIRSDVVGDMVADQHITYDFHKLIQKTRGKLGE